MVINDNEHFMIHHSMFYYHFTPPSRKKKTRKTIYHQIYLSVFEHSVCYPLVILNINQNLKHHNSIFHVFLSIRMLILRLGALVLHPFIYFPISPDFFKFLLFFFSLLPYYPVSVFRVLSLSLHPGLATLGLPLCFDVSSLCLVGGGALC